MQEQLARQEPTYNLHTPALIEVVRRGATGDADAQVFASSLDIDRRAMELYCRHTFTVKMRGGEFHLECDLDGLNMRVTHAQFGRHYATVGTETISATWNVYDGPSYKGTQRAEVSTAAVISAARAQAIKRPDVARWLSPDC